MGLDFGEKRIGIALSDESELIASPKETLERRGNRKDIHHLLELARRERVDAIVIGLPLSMDGSKGPQVEKVGRFVEALRAQTELPITSWDERLTTVTAENALLQSNMSRAKRRQTVDRVAAAIILQDYLDWKRAADERADP